MLPGSRRVELDGMLVDLDPAALQVALADDLPGEERIEEPGDPDRAARQQKANHGVRPGALHSEVEKPEQERPQPAVGRILDVAVAWILEEHGRIPPRG